VDKELLYINLQIEIPASANSDRWIDLISEKESLQAMERIVGAYLAYVVDKKSLVKVEVKVS